ncbi:MAG: histidine kinase N-terminal 7TM domain-containing protein [Myxococcota bacterium]
MEAVLFQVGISAPLVLGLVFYTAARGDAGLVHRYLQWLLVMILVWLLGMLADSTEGPRAHRLGQVLRILPACFMAQLFCVTMLLYGRVEIFEARRSARWAVMAPSFLFLVAFATDPWHGMMGEVVPVVADSEDAAALPPLFLSFQVISNLSALVGLGMALRVAIGSPSPEERRRMALLFTGAALPLVTHLIHTFQLLPIDYPLTPASMGVTALLVVRATQRYRLLDVQPVARRDVIEASSDAVLIADADGVLVDANPTAARLLETPRDRLCGEPLGEALALLGPTEPAGSVARMLEARRRGETSAPADIETAGGQVLELSVGVPRGTLEGDAGTFVVLRDRTGERRAERLLHQSQRLESVGVLAAGVAHEVNNPLAFVRANLAHLEHLGEVMGERADELPKDLRDEVDELGGVIEESLAGLDRIQRIVQGLLRLSRGGSGRFEPCDPNAIVAEAARFASLSGDGDGSVGLDLRLADDLPEVEADFDQLVQVVLNLFLNARLELRDRADPKVVAVTRRAGDRVEIAVEDNGPGVPEAIRGRIFDPFFTTRAPNEGTGLGLSIAFDILRDHGGTIEVGDAETGGACFTVRLPISLR